MQTRILNQFEDFFSQQGFNCNPLKREFRQETDFGYQNVIFRFGSWEDLGRLEILLGLRLEVVEEQIGQFLKGLRGYEPGGNTFLTSLSQIDTQHRRYTASEVADQSDTQAEIIQTLQEQGFPYLRNMQNLSQLDQILNTDLSQDSPWVQDQFGRCLRGMVVAKLIQRPDSKDLATQMEAYLQLHKMPPKYLQRFHQLRDFLSTFSLN